MTYRLLANAFAMIVLQGCAADPAPPRGPIIPSLAEVPASATLIGTFGVVSDPERLTINGLQIAFDNDVAQPAAPITGQNLPLSVGSTIFAEAYQVAHGFRARRIEPFFPIVGVIDRIQQRQGLLDIMGTTVRASANTKITDRRAGRSQRPLAISDIATANRVAVSGLWRGDEVVASRIDILERTGPVLISGLLRPGDERSTIAGTQLGYACCRHLSTPVFARIAGRYQDNFLVVTSLSIGQSLLFSAEVEHLIIQATPVRHPGTDAVDLSGFGIKVAPSSPVAIKTGEPALFIGRYGESFSIEQRIALPTNQATFATTLGSFFP